MKNKSVTIKTVNSFKQLFTLIIMQLRSILDLSFLQSHRKFALKIGQTILILILSTLGVYACFFILRIMLSFQIDIYFLSLLLAIMIIGSFITCLDQMSKSLYEAKDRVVLFTFPIQANMVFFSKIIVAYIQELAKNLSFFGSVILAFGIINDMSALYYLSCLFIYLLFPLITVCASALISIPYFYISKVINKISVLKIGVVTLIIAFFAYSIISISTLVPEKFYIVGQWADISHAISTTFRIFAEKSWLFLVFAKCMMLENFWLNISIVLSISIVCLWLSLLIAQKLFLKMTATLMNEKAVKKEKNSIKKDKSRRVRQKNSFETLIIKELKLLFNNNIIVSTYFFILLSPFLIYLLNTVYAAMPINGVGRALQFGFNFMIITTLACTSATSCATSISNEGGNINMLQSAPVKPLYIGFSKILPCMIINTVMIIICWLMVALKLTASPFQFFFMAASSVFVSLAHIFWSFDIDLLNPQFSKGRDEGNKSQNTNMLKSLFVGILICFLLGLITILTAQENFDFAWIFLFTLSFFLFASRLCLCINRLKIYFKRIKGAL